MRNNSGLFTSFSKNQSLQANNENSYWKNISLFQQQSGTNNSSTNITTNQNKNDTIGFIQNPDKIKMETDTTENGNSNNQNTSRYKKLFEKVNKKG